MDNCSEQVLPKLTVIVVAKNAVSTIARALDSVVSQHYPNIELIVYDGLSTDGTQEVIKQYKSIVSVFKSENDVGPPDAQNKAIAMATGDYVGMLQADDEYEPGALWTVADSILKNTDAEVISFGMFYRSMDSDNRLTVTGCYTDERQLSIDLDHVLLENQTFLLSRFIKRSLMNELGQFNTDHNLWYFANDREWMTRLAIRGCRNVIIPKALYGFIYRRDSLSNNPVNYGKIVDEHQRIANSLLARNDLSESQRTTVNNWRNRQLVYGFWQALFGSRFAEAKSFMLQGCELKSWRFIILSFYLLTCKVLKRIGLRLSNGIDRGTIIKK